MSKENLEKILSFDDEVLHVIKWYANKSPKRKSMTIRAGGTSEVTQATVLSLLETKHLIENADCKWTTIVCNHVMWTTRTLINARERQEYELVKFPQPAVESQAEYIAERNEIRVVMHHYIAGFGKDRSVNIVTECWFRDVTTHELAKTMKVTRERINQLFRKGMRKLQDPAKSYKIFNLLEIGK